MEIYRSSLLACRPKLLALVALAKWAQRRLNVMTIRVFFLRACKGDTLLIHYGVFPPMSMSTAKKRLNITLPKETHIYLKQLALKEHVPEATKAAELLQKALEIEEDAYFSKIADLRAKKSGGSLSHKAFWSRAL